MNIQNKLRCAVIGAGNMGRNHIRTYSEIPEADLVAISDSNEELGKKVSEELKTCYYKNYKEMLKTEKPDVVSICVPTTYHYAVAKDCIKNKVNILLEKPIASNVAEAKKLLKLADKAGIKLMIGHIERHNPVVKKVKELIDSGELGKIVALMARRVGGFPPQIKDANIAVDLAIHDIDIANYLFDDIPVKAFINKQKNHIKKREDSVELFLKYKNASAYIQSNWVTPVKIRKLNITGTEGYLEMDYITQKIEFYKSNYEKFKEVTNDFSDFILKFSEPDRIDISVAKKEPLKEEILFLIKAIKNNKKIDSQFAVEALKIALCK